MKCCDTPDLIIDRYGKSYYYFCATKGCSLKSIEYGTQAAAEIALKKYKSSLIETLDIILPGRKLKKRGAHHKKLNFDESLNPIIKSGSAHILFFSDLMIEKCALPINYLYIGANRRIEEKGPFINVYFFEKESEIPDDMITSINIPYRTESKNPKNILKGINISLAYIFKRLDFRHYYTTELPFTMDLKNRRKMIIDLSTIYLQKSDKPLVNYNKNESFRRRRMEELQNSETHSFRKLTV